MHRFPGGDRVCHGKSGVLLFFYNVDGEKKPFPLRQEEVGGERFRSTRRTCFPEDERLERRSDLLGRATRSNF